MANHLNEALKQFEAVEANLLKLERLWAEISEMLPNLFGFMIEGVSDEALYRDKTRAFRHIAKGMPKIDGYELEYEIEEPEGIQANNLDYHELGEPTATMAYDTHLHRQGEILGEYRFRLGVKRRQLARQKVFEYIADIDSILERLKESADRLDQLDAMPLESWEPLKHAFHAINSLLGSTIQRPQRWSDMVRHLRFGLRQDYNAIIKYDWPAIKPELERALYTDDDPIPVAVADLGELVASNPKGDVVTELKWERLDPKDFERLLFNLITGTAGYENPEWLTHTNAPDDGRDLSVWRVYNDKLSGVTRHRVIIACKHWTSKSVDLAEVTTLKEQMTLWEPPRVDCLTIATSGRFTTQAIRWVEKHNQSAAALKIEMWPGTHFESLLAQRPALIAEFGLR